jgi:hypothetical protein
MLELLGTKQVRITNRFTTSLSLLSRVVPETVRLCPLAAAGTSREAYACAVRDGERRSRAATVAEQLE